VKISVFDYSLRNFIKLCDYTFLFINEIKDNMRDVTLDNFKFILIALVVMGHAVEPLIGQFAWINLTYIFIYLFHMPMFAYVSGAVSDPKLDGKAIYNLATKLLIPYLILEVIYSVFDYVAFPGGALKITILKPYWILWYLVSLILWRLLFSVFHRLKHPIFIATVAGVMIGVTGFEYFLALGRTFVFFPFFLIGYYKHNDILARLNGFQARRYIGAAILLISFGALFFYLNRYSIELPWLYGARSYSWLKATIYEGAIIRTSLYVIAALLGISVLAVTSDKSRFFTSYGKHTLPIYIFHGLILKSILALGFYDYINSDLEALTVFILALFLLPILSSHIARLLMRIVTNPFSYVASLKNRRPQA